MMKKLLKLAMVLPSLLLWQSTYAQYCQGGPSSTGDSNIESITLTGDNSTSISYTGCPGVSGVEDQTTQVVELNADDTYTLDIILGSCSASTYNGVAEVWIDYNQNNTFEPSESIGTATLTSGSGPLSASFTFTVPATAAGGNTRIRAMQHEGGSLPLNPCGSFTWGSVVDFTADITALAISCPFPTGLGVTPQSQTEAELNWTAGGTETQWNIEYSSSTFTPGTGAGTFLTTSNNPETITGLTPNTTYQFYVQAICGPGDESPWVGPVQAYTGYCLPVYTFTGDYLTLFETTGAIQNVNYTASSQPSQGYADLSGVDTIKVEEAGDFDFETNFQGGANTVKIWVDWNEDLVFDASEEVYVGTTPSSAPLHQQLGNIVLPATALQGEYRMRVRSFWQTSHTGNTACQSHTYGSAVDFTLQVLPPASCPRPSDIIAQNITANTAEISWTVTGTETEWEIEYDTTGFTQGTGSFILTNNNPETITGLNGNTTYQAYVRGICAPGDTSDWRGPVTFTTPCETFMAPFFEGFEDGVQPDCWDNITNNTPGTSANVFWRFNTGVTGGAANNGKPTGTYAWVDGSSPTPDTTLLITPFIDLSALSTPALGFEWFSNNTQTPGDNMPLVVALFDGNSWTNIDTLSGDSTEWRYEFYDLSAWAGQTIRISFNVDQTATTSFAFDNDILLDDVEINDCTPAPGVDGNEDICRLDAEINLFDYITAGVSGGKWEFPLNPALIMNDSILSISTLPSGTYEAMYITAGICTTDTTIATLNIFPPSSAGDNGTLEVCMNEPIDLFSGLNGVINLGGTWYDPQDIALPNSLPTASSIPGSYNYDYIVSNGVCPADTQYVEVIVKSDCDYLSVGEAELGNIEVYPNPATDVIKIDNNSNAEALVIEVMDMNGRLVLSDANALFNNNHATISIESLETGVYTLRLSNKEGQRTFKVVKQ